MASCEKVDIPREEQTDSYDQVYMSAAVRNPNIVSLKMMDSAYSITYGGSYGGVGTPGQDIDIQFKVDEEKVAQYNAANGTSYSMLPASCYSFTAENATLATGTLSTSPLAIKVNPAEGMELFKEYLLAISIVSTKNDFKVNPSLRTAYYIVKASLDFADFPEFDRSGWSILAYSSQEPEEGETNGGLALHTIDGKLTTFWHTQWSPSNAAPPHWLAVDLGSSQIIHGLAFTGRQSTKSGKPNQVDVAVSTDGASWTAAGTLTLENINAQQKFFLPVTQFPEARYIRITVVSNYGNQGFTHLAELGAF